MRINDHEFYDRIRKAASENNKDLVSGVAVKLLYHPMTLIFTFMCLVCVGGTLEGGTPFFIGFLIGYAASYIGILVTTLIAYAMMGNFATVPPEQFTEILWLMDKGYTLYPNHIMLQQRTMKTKKEIKEGFAFLDGMMQELQNAGYSKEEVECLRQGFIPVSITDRCGMGFAKTYERNYDMLRRFV